MKSKTYLVPLIIALVTWVVSLRPNVSLATSIPLPFAALWSVRAAPAFSPLSSAMPTSTRGDGAVVLLAPDSPASAQNPAFSPDGRTLLFTLFHRGYNAGPAGLYLLALGGGPPVALLDEADHNSVNLPGSTWNAIVSRIAFSSDRLDTDEIWTIAPNGSNLYRVTSHSSPYFFIEPSFSPDGQWIVFEVDTDASEDRQQGSIWKVRADGTGLAQLTDGPGRGTDDRQPNWSPAGDRILFQRRVPVSGDWNLYTMAPDGSDVRQATTAPSSDTDASWSPDGRWIVYSSDYGGLPAPNIFIVPAEGGAPIRVTRDAAHEDSAPSWSPDGTWIAFESHPGQDENMPASLWLICLLNMSTASMNFGFDGTTHTLYISNIQFLGGAYTVAWKLNLTNGNWDMAVDNQAALDTGGIIDFSRASVGFSGCLEMTIRDFILQGRAYIACWKLDTTNGDWVLIGIGESCSL